MTQLFRRRRRWRLPFFLARTAAVTAASAVTLRGCLGGCVRRGVRRAVAAIATSAVTLNGCLGGYVRRGGVRRAVAVAVAVAGCGRRLVVALALFALLAEFGNREQSSAAPGLGGLRLLLRLLLRLGLFFLLRGGLLLRLLLRLGLFFLLRGGLLLLLLLVLLRRRAIAAATAAVGRGQREQRRAGLGVGRGRAVGRRQREQWRTGLGVGRARVVGRRQREQLGRARRARLAWRERFLGLRQRACRGDSASHTDLVSSGLFTTTQ